MHKLLPIALFALSSQSALAHEGDHGAPGSVQAPKGGVVKSLETLHLEVLSQGKAVQIFAYDTNLKPVDVSKYPTTATVTLPKKRPETVKLAQKNDHWAFEYDAKGAHRYTLELNIKQSGHNDKLKWTIEPKKQ